MTEANDALMIGNRTDGTLVNRPLSPHIGIYRWPVTMAASIMNRITGVALSVGTLLLVWWLVAAASGPAAFATVQSFLASPLGLLALLGWTGSLFYHLFAGLRHLIWDSGLGFGKHSLNMVSWLVIGAAGLATALVWVAAYTVMGSLTVGQGSSKTPQIAVMQSKLGRVRGMGAAHAGYHHWHVERVTAIALVPLTLWFIVSVLRMLGADQPAVAAWAGRPLNAALLLALVGMTFQHTQLGLQVIYEDYIHTAKLRNAVVLATKGAALILGLLAGIAVLKLAFAAH